VVSPADLRMTARPVAHHLRQMGAAQEPADRHSVELPPIMVAKLVSFAL